MAFQAGRPNHPLNAASARMLRVSYEVMYKVCVF